MQGRLVEQSVRIVGFALGAVAALMLTGALLLHFFYDGARLEADVTSEVSDTYGRGLNIEGGLQLRLWPRPAVYASRISLSEPDSEEIFLSLQEAHLTLALPPLLRGRYVVAGVQARQGRARLMRERDGQWNFEDFLSPPPDARPLREVLAPEAVHIPALALDFRDAASGVHLTLPALRVATGPLYRGSEGRLSLVGEGAAAALGLEGTLSFETRYTWREQAGLLLEAPALRLAGKLGGLAASECSLSARQLEHVQASRSWTARGLRLSARGALGRRTLDLAAEGRELAGLPEAPRSETLSATLDLRGSEDRLNGTFTVDRLAPATAGFTVQEIRLALTGRRGSQEFEGSLRTPLRAAWKEGRWEAERITADALLRASRTKGKDTRATVAGSGLWVTGAPAAAKTAARAARGQLKLALQAGAATWRAQASWQGGATAEAGTASFEVFGSDFDGTVVNEGIAALAESPFAQWPRYRVDGRIELRQARLGGMTIDALQLPVTLSGGRLEAQPALEAYGGRLTSSARLDLKEGRGQWQAGFEGIDLAGVARDAGQPLPFGGRLSGDGSFEAAGKTLSQLLSAANGLMHTRLRDGWLGADLAAGLAGLRTSPGQRLASAAGARTAVQELRANVALRQGESLYTQSLSAALPWGRLAGIGTIDLKTDTMDLALRTSLSAAPRNAPELAPLRGKSVTLRMSGGIAGPVLSLEASTGAKKTP